MATLVSVNVGMPRDVAWQGKIVRTGIWKTPVQGKVMARLLNLDGDGQGDLAGHGGEQRAVMVYQLDSYRYWQAQLRLGELEYGQFGENFTVDGLGDDQVCIGDRYKIGTALFEVTQPRVTCYRLGIRMQNPQMPALVVSRKRPGFYFRVLEEGEVAAGDEIVKVTDGPERLTVAEVDGLLYLPGHSREALNRAIKIPALSQGWRASFEALLHADDENGNAGLAAPSLPLAWSGFRTLRVAEKKQESVDVVSFIFKSEEGEPLPAFHAGQFLVFKLQPAGDAAPILRSYSLSGGEEPGTYRVSVKLADGEGSRFFHEHVGAGDLVSVSAPRGSFLLAQRDGPVVFLSAGIGATPVLAMLHALSAMAAQREIWWCYGARNEAEHPFAAEVRRALGKLSGGHSLVAYSHPGDGDRLGEDYDVRGRLNGELLRDRNVPRTADFYLCGPSAFLTDITAALQAWGVPDARIHSEIFSTVSAITPGIAKAILPRAHPPQGETGTGPKVFFSRSGLSVPWDAKYGNLLAFAEACDVPVRWACRAGVCHTCESGLIDGQIAYAPEPLDRPAAGNLLICCSAPVTEVEIDL
jgi:ferredoxin-NADP reductase/MOSC domain-containing protein YiiM